MRNYFTLLKVDTLNSYSFVNKSTTIAKKIGNLSLALLILFAMVSIGVSVGGVSYFFQQAGLLGQLLSVLAIVALVMSLFSAIRSMSTGLFESRDYEMLSSMPISEKVLLLVKLTRAYFDSTFVSFILVLPSIIGIGIACKMPFLYYIYTIIAFIFVPVPSMVIAAILSIFLLQLFNRFVFLKKLVGFASLILYALFFIPYFSLTMNAPQQGDINPEDISNLVSSQGENGVFNLYPFSGLIEKISLERDFLSLIIFIGISLVILALFILIFQKSYKKINLSIREHVNKSDYTHKSYKISSITTALMKKDITNFSSYSAVLMQSLMGGMLACIFIFVTLYTTKSLETIPNEYNHYIALGAVAMGIYMSTIAPYSAFSISIEGNNLWILKSLPIKAAEIFKSKIYITLIINIPATIIALVLIQAKFRLNILYFILISIIYLIQIIISSVYGMYFNLLFPKTEWDNINKAVKNYGGIIASIFASILLITVLTISFVGLNFLLPNPNFSVLCAIIILIQGIFLAIFLILLNKHGTQLFDRISS